ncbi:MAG: hypothetical protein M0Z41_16345 [Peptococcaceae bacterium]|jgi:hypothetical protein|nr:hypothetical protein [Peptococcaceae bacterium]
MISTQVITEAESLLGMPKDSIVKASLIEFILSKIKENSQIIEGLKGKYNVPGYLDLEDKIKQGKIPGHPAWEDVILWEQLFTHTAKLNQIVKFIEEGADTGFLKSNIG